MCARQGASSREWKSPVDPVGGTTSLTARVFTARWNLKEAAGKALARRTETAYEAVMLDKKANIFKVRYLYGEHGRICGRHKREGGSALPGEICPSAIVLPALRGAGMGGQKSAEGIVGLLDRAEGLNMNYRQEP